MDLERPTGSRELIELLLTIGRLKRTGILTVQSEQQVIGVTFLSGEIVSSDAMNESLEEGLGRVLSSRDLVSAEDFSLMVAEYEAGGGRVTDLLVERNYIDHQQLMDARRWQTYLLCREVLGWEACEYKFYPGSEVAHEEGMQPLAVEELLVRAAEELGAAGPLPGSMPLAAAVYRKTESEEVTAGRDELLIGLATGDTDGATDLKQLIDGRSSVVQLASDAGLTEYEARLTIYLMERAGAVERVEGVPDEPLLDTETQTTTKLARAGSSAARAGKRWLAERKRSPKKQVKVRTAEVEWLAWPARILGFGASALLAVLAWSDAGRFLLPFPWHESLRQAVLDEQTSAAYLKIDRAAKTSFLLDGHFPATLDELISDAYLTPRDLVDPVGRRLGYASQVAGYLIYPEDEGDAAPGSSRTETVTGNFLLDPEFVPERRVESPPLVLID